MNIIKNLTDTSLNMYLSSHPFIKQIKREAKLLNKIKKQQSLMACQNKIALEYGFNNFHHVLQTLKKQNTSFSFNKNYKNIYEPFYLGYETVYQKPIFQKFEQAFLHNFIIGPTIYNKFDLKLAEQAIEKNCSIFFINFEKNNLFEQFYTLSIKYKRFLDFYPIGKEYNTIPNNFLKYSPVFLTELFFPDEEVNIEKFNQFSNNVFVLLKHHHNLSQLSIEDILKFIEEENYFKIENLKDDENIVLEKIYDIYNNTINDYKYFHSILISKINHVLNLGIFSNKNDIPFEILRSLNKIVLVDNCEDAKIITQLIKNMVYMELCAPIDYQKDFDILNQLNKTNPAFLFLRGIKEFKLLQLLFYQARSRKISINISIPHFSNYENEIPFLGGGNLMIESCEINKYLQTIKNNPFDITIKEDNLNTDLFFILQYVHMVGYEAHRCSISKSLF